MGKNGSSASQLLDIVEQYYPPIRREDFKDPGMLDRMEASSPMYKAWMAKRAEGWLNYRTWDTVVGSLRPELPEYKLRNETAPFMSCYEVEVRRKDDPELADGVVYTSLVVRVSFLAPVYEMYESRWRMEVPALKSSGVRYKDLRRTHDISPAFQPAADAFARAIEAHYGYRLVGPEVLDLELVNVLLWESGYYRGTLRDALFSEYRL